MIDKRLIRYHFKCCKCEEVHMEEFMGVEDFFDFFDECSVLVDKNQLSVFNLYTDGVFEGAES